MAFSFGSAAQRMLSWLMPRKPVTFRHASRLLSGSRLLIERLEDRLTPSANPTLSATPSPAAVSYTGASVTLTDTAVLSNGNNPTGTILFDLLGPGGNYVDMESVTVSGNGTYTTPAGYPLPSSGTVAGDYTWEVDYSGDSGNQAATAKMTTLGSFDSSTRALPTAGLIEDGSGNFFGTAQFGTGNGYGIPGQGNGTVFEIAAGTGVITTLATFNGSNGSNPQAGLIEDGNGNLFGTATGGGSGADGAVFELSSTPLNQVVVTANNNTSVSIVPPDQTNTYGGEETVIVNLTSGSGTPTGQVSLTVDSGTTQTATLVNGSATFTLSGLTAGSHTLSAKYAAQNGYLAGSGTEAISVSKVATTTAVSSPSVAYGTNGQVTVTVGPNSGTSTPTGSVSLTVNGASFETEPLGADGTAVFTIPSTDCQLGASYSGDANDFGSASTATFTVTPAPTQTSIAASTITYGSSATVTLTVSNAAGVVPGNVTLSVDGKPAVTQSLSNGTAGFSFSGLGAGSHSLTATYSGQGYFAASINTGSLTVNPVATTSTVTAQTVSVGTNAVVKVNVQSPGQPPDSFGSGYTFG
jgi:hypothetical protein